MENFLYNNKVQKFPLAFRKRNAWKVGMRFGTLARRMKHWYAIGTLAHLWPVPT